MKKILITSFLITSSLLAGPVHTVMDDRIKGQSYSGTQNDYDAAIDGLGLIPLQHHSGTTSINSELKIQKKLVELLKKSDDKEKTSNVKLSLSNGTLGTSEDLVFVSNLENNITNVDNSGDNNFDTVLFSETIDVVNNLNFEQISTPYLNNTTTLASALLSISTPWNELGYIHGNGGYVDYQVIMDAGENRKIEFGNLTAKSISQVDDRIFIQISENKINWTNVVITRSDLTFIMSGKSRYVKFFVKASFSNDGYARFNAPDAPGWWDLKIVGQ